MNTLEAEVRQKCAPDLSPRTWTVLSSCSALTVLEPVAHLGSLKSIVMRSRVLRPQTLLGRILRMTWTRPAELARLLQRRTKCWPRLRGLRHRRLMCLAPKSDECCPTLRILQFPVSSSLVRQVLLRLAILATSVCSTGRLLRMSCCMGRVLCV